MNSLENDLEPSILAARADGPNTGIPTAHPVYECEMDGIYPAYSPLRKALSIPSTNGCSGPGINRVTWDSA